MQKIGTVTKVKVGAQAGKYTFCKSRPAFFVEIDFDVNGITCKKNISDVLSLRFDRNLPNQFIEQKIPDLILGKEFFVKPGLYAHCYVPAGAFYDSIVSDIRGMWRKEGGWDSWRKKEIRTCA